MKTYRIVEIVNGFGSVFQIQRKFGPFWMTETEGEGFAIQYNSLGEARERIRSWSKMKVTAKIIHPA